MQKLIKELDELILSHSLIAAIRIAAIIYVNWDEVRKALLAWDCKKCSNLEQEKPNE